MASLTAITGRRSGARALSPPNLKKTAMENDQVDEEVPNDPPGIQLRVRGDRLQGCGSPPVESCEHNRPGVNQDEGKEGEAPRGRNSGRKKMA